jgi:hypothetical protein
MRPEGRCYEGLVQCMNFLVNVRACMRMCTRALKIYLSTCSKAYNFVLSFFEMYTHKPMKADTNGTTCRILHLTRGQLLIPRLVCPHNFGLDFLELNYNTDKF